MNAYFSLSLLHKEYEKAGSKGYIHLPNSQSSKMFFTIRPETIIVIDLTPNTSPQNVMLCIKKVLIYYFI